MDDAHPHANERIETTRNIAPRGPRTLGLSPAHVWGKVGQVRCVGTRRVYSQVNATIVNFLSQNQQSGPEL
jgi:hypothetical protein